MKKIINQWWFTSGEPQDEPKGFTSEKQVKEFLVKNYKNRNVMDKGIEKLLGWAFDLRPFLNHYVVKQYDHWQEYYAINKTWLRKALFGKIDKIQQLD